MKTYRIALALLSCSSLVFAVAAVGCGSSSGGDASRGSDAGPTLEAGTVDSGASKDAGPSSDASMKDASENDSGSTMMACAPEDAGSPDGYPAAHAPFPQVVYGGAGILQTPEVVTVTFPSDTLAPQLEQFGDDILNTCWWNTVRAGYCETGGATCVGPGGTSTKPHVEMTTAPAASYTDSSQGGASTLQTFIQQQVASGVFPAPTPGTIYVMYFPASTTINLDGAPSCSTFGGYHTSTTVTPPGGSATQVAYAVLPRCAPQAPMQQIDELTFAASHEITEASTDPFAATVSASGYYLNLNDGDSLPWNFFPTGGEVGDLCVDLLGEAFGNPQDGYTAMGAHGSYSVQRIWSIGAAAGGGDPCVPYAFEPYFNVAIASGFGTQHMSTVGSSVTFEADAFSTGPTNGAWALAGLDVGAYLYGTPQVLQVTPSSNAVSNGDKVMVTVKLVQALQTIPGTNVPGALFILKSTGANGSHAWPGLILP